MKEIIIESVEQFDLVVKEGVSLIDFYADWCGPCRMLAPTIHELETQYSDVKFCKVDVDNEPELAAMFKVSSIPMIAVVKNNTLVDFHLGYTSKDELSSFIKANC